MIVLDLSLEAIALAPGLFEKFGTTGENILFTATDYLAPETSDLFQELFRNMALRSKAERLAALCKTDFEKVPSLSDFVSGRWAPSISISPRPHHYETKPTFVEVVREVFYQGNVLDATDFNRAISMEGDRVELIGKVTEVKSLDSKYRTGRKQKYLVFLNFGDWRGKQLKASIRGLGTQRLRETVDKSWTGQWVSVTGMVEPVFRRAGYEHIAITVSESSQLHRISPDEAAFRLGRPKSIRVKIPASAPNKPPPNVFRSNNERILEDIAQGSAGNKKPSGPPANLSAPAALPMSRNQKLLSQIGASNPPPPLQTAQPVKSQGVGPSPAPVQIPSKHPAQPIPTTSAPSTTSAGNSKDMGCGFQIIIFIILVILFLISKR